MITTFNTFILENNRIDTTTLSKDDVKRIIEENCKDFDYNDKKIYRGIYLEQNPYLIDPKKYHRLSANADNYYNMIVDNSILWKDYPKRKHALIGTLMYYQAVPYGTVFRVIPFDGAKFGVVSQGDMWQSFDYLQSKTGIDELNYFDILIDDFHQALFDEKKLNNLVYNIFVKQVKKIEDEIKKDPNGSSKKISQYYRGSYDDYVDFGRTGKEYYKKFFNYISDQIVTKNKSLLSVLEDLLSPIRNGFEVLSYKGLLNKKVKTSGGVPEVWTDSKCILIPDSLMFDLNMRDLDITSNGLRI
jgi:hypothetical protein